MQDLQSKTADRRDFMKLGLSAAMAAALSAAGPASARAAQEKKTSAGCIDVHTHWAPDPYAPALNVEVGDKFLGPRNPLDFDMDKRLAWMDQHGVQVSVLTLSGRMPWQIASPEAGVKLARLINDAGIETHAKYPERLWGAIELPVRDPQAALAELNRVAGKPGLKAVHLPNSVANDDYLFDPAFDPLLARCQELGYPLLFHPLDGDSNFYGGKDRLGGRWQPTLISNTLGFPFEHATTAAKFIVSGTLDKYPKLDILLPHAGGAFPFVAGRVEYALDRRKFPLQRPFREYLRRFHYDTLAFYPEALRYLINLVGSDRVVIGTDSFFLMDVDEPTALLDELKLPAADYERITRGNAARLLRL